MQLISAGEFQGLKFTSRIIIPKDIAAIVGRNGAGKSRLLQAIAEGKVHVMQDSGIVPRDRIQHLKMENLQPNLTLGFDAVKYRDDVGQAIARYIANRGKFNIDPQKSIASIGNYHVSRGAGVSVHLLAHIVSQASSTLEKDVNSLDEQDIADFFLSAPVASMGSLDVTATMLGYWHRLEQNVLNEFRNTKYGTDLPYWTPSQFEERFGPPPWDVFNEFLNSALDGQYYIKAPTQKNFATYEAQLFRADGKTIDPSWLSSGEKTLMWLCLSMYASDTGRIGNSPRLLLLDEPDAALHPQMVQKLHMALNTIVQRFGASIIFTTHSPTTVALFESGSIFKVSEQSLTPLQKDEAIGELLVGVDQILIHYTNRRQVYVESHRDAEIYRALFYLLKMWRRASSPFISLSFIAAAPKLAAASVRQLLNSHLGDQDEGAVTAFIQALNGQGNCTQVIGTVESLIEEGNTTVHGLIDWDLVNEPKNRVHVLGDGLFYSIESAILNPLTLGLYLLCNYPEKLLAQDYGLPEVYDPLSICSSAQHWQTIADGVTRRVLNIESVSHDVQCVFLGGERLFFDRRYVHMNGHALEALLKEIPAYPFLNSLARRPGLLVDVIHKGIRLSHGRSMPICFLEVFGAIQLSC
ncbi:MAG: ATP-binding protein [Steroidobacteraceae bacterium]